MVFMYLLGAFYVHGASKDAGTLTSVCLYLCSAQASIVTVPVYVSAITRAQALFEIGLTIHGYLLPRVLVVPSDSAGIMHSTRTIQPAVKSFLGQ